MKHFKNLTLVIATVGMLLFTSCGNDDDLRHKSRHRS